MGQQVIEATKRAIAKVVEDFQGDSDRFWNERDIHWNLFHHLKQEEVIKEKYTTQLIRAEFPTLKKFDERNGNRGHYDLVVLDPQSYSKPVVQNMDPDTPWDDFLNEIKLTVAIEIKLWLARLKLERADWDIKKLTEPPNNILNAYFLNFVQLDFTRPYLLDYYRQLREYLIQQKRHRSHLKILCVPSDVQIQPDPSDNWVANK